MANTNNLVVVTAATGNIGRKLVERLLEKKKMVRAVARNEKKLEPLAKIGAEILAASVEDPSAMTKAFSGAAAVFILIPPKYDAPDMRAYQNKVSESYFTALQSCGTASVVNLSSVGAHMKGGSGPILGLHDNEERLNKLKNVNILHLRPAYFMENLLMNLDLIQNMGIMGSPLKPDFRTPMIATQDIAAVAAAHLSKLDFQGKFTRELHGQRDVTILEVTRILGKAIGREDLKYVQFPYEEAKKAMIGMGLSENVADLMIEMQKNMNEGTLRPAEARSPRTTTPTSIEDFSRVFAAAFHAQKEKVPT
jgi:uncharacterized protein YbjT (DUF2867 family)